MGLDMKRERAAFKEPFGTVIGDRSVRADEATGERRVQVGGEAGGTNLSRGPIAWSDDSPTCPYDAQDPFIARLKDRTHSCSTRDTILRWWRCPSP